MSSPVRSTGAESGSSPRFRSQRKMSAGTITRKIQTLEETIESLRQQLVFSRSEEEQISSTISKGRNTKPKQPKEAKQPKEKIPAKPKEPKEPKEAKEPKEPKEPKQKKSTDEEEKDKIPMPWTGFADFTTCVGLKAQYGLFIQCGKACDATPASFQIDNHECRFCSDCSKKCDENGKHSIGTVEERIEAGVGKYVNAKTGKKETIYIEVLEKMKITKEQALESAQKRGFQIPDWMLEKAEKKRGRPAASDIAAAATDKVADKIELESKSKIETKEKKPRPPRVKKTVAAKACVATNDTPPNSVQSSVCIEPNTHDDDECITPTPTAETAATTVAAAAAVASAPQEKKKRGRPTKSNTQSNVAESEMQQLIVQATTEKKKRLSLDADTKIYNSEESEQQATQVETQLTFEDTTAPTHDDDDELFEMFDKMLENEEEQKTVTIETAEVPLKEEVVAAVTVAVAVAVVVVPEKKEKKRKVEKVAKEKDVTASKKKEAAAAKKKKEEEAAAAAAAAAEESENGEEEEEEEEELECEEYEYDGDTYGLAPNGDIYSQDGELVGKLTNGVPKMF